MMTQSIIDHRNNRKQALLIAPQEIREKVEKFAVKRDIVNKLLRLNIYDRMIQVDYFQLYFNGRKKYAKIYTAYIF